jgi:hypothetical protein
MGTDHGGVRSKVRWKIFEIPARTMIKKAEVVGLSGKANTRRIGLMIFLFTAIHSITYITDFSLAFFIVHTHNQTFPLPQCSLLTTGLVKYKQEVQLKVEK